MKTLTIKKLKTMPTKKLTKEGYMEKKRILKLRRESITSGVIGLGIIIGMIQIINSNMLNTNPKLSFEVVIPGALMFFFMAMRFAGKGRKTRISLEKFNKKAGTYLRK